MTCRKFRLAIESRNEASGAARLPAALQAHADSCAACRSAYRDWLISRSWLQSLESRPERDENAAEHFWLQLQARLRQPPEPEWKSWLRVPVFTRELVMASAALLLLTGVFTYNVKRLETPSMGEAIALDAPHVHARHPYLDHQRKPEDVLLSVMTR